jgi:Senescence regulator
MEEFQESDILWPELEEDQEENNMKLDAGSTTSRAQPRKSAPMLIPSKVPVSHSWTAGFNYGRNAIYMNDDDRDDDGDDDNGSRSGTDADTPNGSMVPPHILMSRKYANTMPFSVCVGNGRKLKGREQRAVRISVLRLTGYVEK